MTETITRPGRRVWWTTLAAILVAASAGHAAGPQAQAGAAGCRVRGERSARAPWTRAR